MPRVRLGVALLIPPPFDAEIDGLRRALGDGALGRIPAHLTLVPPVNVREDRLGEVLAVLRRAGAATRPFTASLGPSCTFLPDNPTLHLTVGDESAVRALRDRVFVDPLARSLTWPFVPHVTLADQAAPDRIAAALVALARPIIIGRGGLPVELTVSDEVDPEAARLGPAPLVVTARAEGEVAGYAEGWCRAPAAHLSSLVVSDDALHLGVGRHLVAAFRAEAAERGCDEVTLAPAVEDALAVG